MTAFIVVMAYIVITTLVGWSLSNKGKNSDDTKSFFLAKKNLGPVLICFLMFGEMVAGSSTVGSATTAFGSGLSSVWTNWGQALGVIVFVFTVSKFYRVASHNGAFSVPEAFEFRFDHRTRMVVMVIVMVVYGIMFAMQPRAAAAVLAPMIRVDVTLMAWVMGGIFILQALVGLRGIAGMNIVHATVLYVGVGLVAALAFCEVGDLEALRALLVQNGWTWLTAVCTILFSLFHWPCSTTCLTIAKETGSAKWTLLAFVLPTAVGMGLCGLVSAAARAFGLA